MAAIGVTQAAGVVVIFGEEESSESAVGRIFAEELIHGTQEALRLIEGDGALAAQIGLQIGQQESRSDSLSRDVGDQETEPLLAETEEVVIIATDFASLDAKSRIFKGLERRRGLREEPGLHLFGNFKLLRGTAFGFQSFSKGAALRFDGLGHLVEADQRKGIAIEVLKTGKDATPNRSMLRAGRRGIRRLRSAHLHPILEAFQARRELKANSALGPFAILGNHILGDKGDRRGPADELGLFRARLRRDEREVRGAVGRGDGYKPRARLNAGVKDQLEAELIKVKVQAVVEIPNVNRNRLETQVGVLAIQANNGAVNPPPRRVAHGRNYKPGAAKRTLAAECCQARAQHPEMLGTGAAPLQIRGSQSSDQPRAMRAW